MKKALIIDDEMLARKLVREFLTKHPEIEIVGECADGFEGIKLINELNPDVIFLDIQMPKITGFEMLELIPNPPHVIFTTAFDEYAIKAFDANAIDYLLKPFSKERFDHACAKFLDKKKDQPEISTLLEAKHSSENPINRIVIKEGSEIIILLLEDISHLEAYDDYVKIHHKTKVYLKKQTMNHFENVLNSKHFVRIHRSYIININKLTGIESHEKNSYTAILTNGKAVPISRNSYSQLKEILGV